MRGFLVLATLCAVVGAQVANHASTEAVLPPELQAELRDEHVNDNNNQDITNVICPAKYNGVIQIPPSRVYQLTAEAKSGTTWIQVQLTEFLAKICKVYDGLDGFECVPSCQKTGSKSSKKNAVKAASHLSVSNTCRQLKVKFKDKRIASAPVTSEIHIETNDKHLVPLIPPYEHPNETPVFPQLPDWLQRCVQTRNNKNCWPSFDRLADTEYLGNFGIFLEKVVHYNLTLMQARKAFPAWLADPEKYFSDVQSSAYFTIIRDPRSVAVSAANFVPGHQLMGEDYHSRERVNEFVVGIINATTAWTEFRKRWLNLLSLGMPIHAFYYEDLIADSAKELRKFAEGAGLCYTAESAGQIANSNTQQYYDDHAGGKIQAVTVTRTGSQRPTNDTVKGFLVELDEEVRS